MKSNNNYSEGYANYLKNIKKEKVKVLLIQIIKVCIKET